ncbi:hypothetical protein [Streptomyces parvus]|uniref:hypothetical protein n=1 Tax=Streptomyces parvus TaxID=66428 RepID=UPI0021015C8B|nr:hypothetical protein [Streptomyces parvus]MCQ1575343.1 hypothetical protein [Streptomyces parvus]
MKNYILTMRIEADDDVNPDRIREELYDAGGDVPFGFAITAVAESVSEHIEDPRRAAAHDAAVAKLQSIYSGQLPESLAREIADAVLKTTEQ